MTQITTGDHDEIKRWAESLNGTPEIIDHPRARADRIGIRIDFPGKRDNAIHTLTRATSWEEFFRILDEQGLLLAFEDKPTDDDTTMWYHFEPRNPPPEEETKEHGAMEGLEEIEPQGLEVEADEPEGDWPEGSEPNPGGQGSPRTD